MNLLKKIKLPKMPLHIFENPTELNFMDSKLIIKDIGPIKEVNLDLKNVNVFIGKQSSGKSVIAKIFTIFKAPRKFFNGSTELDNKASKDSLENVFNEYNIKSFLNPRTHIEFESELHKITYKNLSFEYEHKLLDKINYYENLAKNFEQNKESIIQGLDNLSKKFVYFSIRASRFLEDEKAYAAKSPFRTLKEHNVKDVIDVIKEIEYDLSTNTASYIPSERNFINIIKGAALNLMKNNVPIPNHILSFGAELERIDTQIINLDFIQNGLKYQHIEGEDRIFFNEDEFINLSEASSGIQSVVPILSIIEEKLSFVARHKSFVIEEPELNLFPTAQYDLIQLLESMREDPYWEDDGAIHSYTTHSPFILSAINNLIYAHIVRGKITRYETSMDYHEARLKSDGIVKNIVKAVINPKSISAYQIFDGNAASILNKESGLIDDNFIDDASDKINEDFEKLMELLK